MPATIRDYIRLRQPPEWTIDADRLRLKCPEWKGNSWVHEILIAEPRGGRKGDTAILEITGDNVADEDLRWAQVLADDSGFPVFILCQVPNQPLWDLREDHLIAHTFETFLDTGELDWPLLLPMTRSAMLAIDAIQEWLGGEISRFVVTGASKRGWTSWLVGMIGDERVIGIAPRLFDNLHFLRQIEKQQREWNEFSKEIDPYVLRNLPDRFQTAEGNSLLKIVDPWHSLNELTVPVLMMHGAFDPFWMIDALGEYWDDIKVPKWCYVAYGGHQLWPIEDWSPVLSAFTEACSLGVPLPQMILESSRMDDDVFRFRVSGDETVKRYGLSMIRTPIPRRFTADCDVLQVFPNELGECVVVREEFEDIAVIPEAHVEFLGREIVLALPPFVIDRKYV